jgi:hypothetical protein
MAMTKGLPWYREPWPWIVMSGPALVVVAGVVTAAIALRTSDGLVADDYYKQGLAVNRVLAREARADALALAASIQFNPARDQVQVRLAAGDGFPARLRMALVHPTRGGGDRWATLEQVAPGIYRGALQVPEPANYHLQLEDGARTWRLAARWRPGDDVVTLGLPR